MRPFVAGVGSPNARYSGASPGQEPSGAAQAAIMADPALHGQSGAGSRPEIFGFPLFFCGNVLQSGAFCAIINRKIPISYLLIKSNVVTGTMMLQQPAGSRKVLIPVR